MALVAYGSSGESDSEEEDVPNIQSAEFKSKTGSKDLKDNDSLPTRPDKLDKTVDFDISDDDDDFGGGSNNSFLDEKPEGPDIMALISSRLPNAKITAFSRGFVDKNEDTSDMIKKVDYGTKIEEPPAKKKKRDGPVKISIPSLRDLKNTDDEDEKPVPRVTASKTGSGLFSLLPEPKNKTTRRPINVAIPESGGEDIRVRVSALPGGSNLKPTGAKRSGLVPHIIAQPKAAAISPPPVRAAVAAATSATSKSTPLDDSDSEGEDLLGINSGSYFPEDSKVAVPGGSGLNKPSTFFGMKKPPPPVLPVVQDFVSLQTYEEEDLGPAVAPYPPTQYNTLPDAGLVDNQAAIERLAGKAAKRREFEDMQIIDINEADMRGDPNVWLTKALTEEQAPAPNRKGAVKGIAKHKHQITYLAHQAKERDFELRQEWSQARANKMASMNKYGFC